MNHSTMAVRQDSRILMKELRKDGISTTNIQSLDRSFTRPKKVGYTIGPNQGNLQLLRGRLRSTQSKYWTMTKSVPNF